MQYFSTIVVGIMTAFALVGIIDQLFLKNRLGLGAEFQRGIEMIGPLCLAIVGIIALVPEMKWGIEHTLTPLYRTLGLDPSMAVTSILAIDMGGYQLAESVAIDPLIGQWAGIVYGSMMGATIVFTIPVGLAAIGKQDVAAFSKGVLYGIAAIPIGTFVGGLVMGIPVGTVALNLIPPVIFSVIIIVCLALWPGKTTASRRANFLCFHRTASTAGTVKRTAAPPRFTGSTFTLPISPHGSFRHNGKCPPTPKRSCARYSTSL